jgi:spore germination protein GerM
MSLHQLRPFAALIGVALTLAACGPPILEQSASTTSAAASQASTAVSAHLIVAVPARTSGQATHVAAAPLPTRSAAAPNAATASLATQVTAAIFFTAGSSLVSESRQVPAAAPARGSIEALLAGPKVAGHFSQVPSGTRLRSVNLAAGTATVDLSYQVQNLEGSPAIPLFLGQIVDTLTQFPDVQRVVLEVNGQPLRSLGGEGAAVPEPLDHALVQRMLSGQ